MYLLHIFGLSFGLVPLKLLLNSVCSLHEKWTNSNEKHTTDVERK